MSAPAEPAANAQREGKRKRESKGKAVDKTSLFAFLGSFDFKKAEEKAREDEANLAKLEAEVTQLNNDKSVLNTYLAESDNEVLRLRAKVESLSKENVRLEALVAKIKPLARAAIDARDNANGLLTGLVRASEDQGVCTICHTVEADVLMEGKVFNNMKCPACDHPNQVCSECVSSTWDGKCFNSRCSHKFT
eukprot:jgi/Tetstr1/464027/TSEL_008832.t1